VEARNVSEGFLGKLGLGWGILSQSMTVKDVRIKKNNGYSKYLLTWLPSCETSWSPLSQRCPSTVQEMTWSCPTNHGLPPEDIASLAIPLAHVENLDAVLGALVEIYYSIVETRGRSR